MAGRGVRDQGVTCSRSTRGRGVKMWRHWPTWRQEPGGVAGRGVGKGRQVWTPRCTLGNSTQVRHLRRHVSHVTVNTVGCARARAGARAGVGDPDARSASDATCVALHFYSTLCITSKLCNISLLCCTTLFCIALYCSATYCVSAWNHIV